MKKHRWTDAEKALLCELYPTCTAAQIAERIYGSHHAAKAVHAMAFILGLQKFPRLDPEKIEQVRQLHSEGLPDSVMARRLGINRDTVKHLRQRLKLPSNPDIEGRRRSIINQRRTLGIRSGGELRKLAYRRFAARNGWPEDLRPREVQILNALAARGVPMSKRELCETIGMSAAPTFPGGKRRILLSGNGHGGTYTASLAHRELIVRLPRAGVVHGQGKGRSVDLYCLGPRALVILQQRAEEQQCETARTTP